ncbi:hypothetical protein LCGC14_0251270 [marine sediment metagenome]|uniref:Uncharacterized protein n=1 Tax=marine sediment metagenome TaxID=412755 RepID=A0A0F9U489_9ZZZZ
MSTKWLDNVTWPKAALFGGVGVVILLIVHPPTAERILLAIMDLARILANAVGTLGGG